MKIVVCVKEVPGRDTRYQILDHGREIDTSQVSLEMSECDEHALEEGLKLKDRFGGEVTLLSAGSTGTEKTMRKGLAMGADRGILVEDDAGRLASPFLVAAAFRSVLESEAWDLILTGTQSDDWGNAQTGVILAEYLSIPHATIVMQLDARPEDGTVRALREMESGWFQWLELQLPSLLTIQAGSSPVRYASLKGIMQAKNKPIRRVPVDDLTVDEALPSFEILGLYSPRIERKAEMLQGSTDEVVAQLVDRLRNEAKVI